jgi:hypothetical protein
MESARFQVFNDLKPAEERFQCLIPGHVKRIRHGQDLFNSRPAMRILDQIIEFRVLVIGEVDVQLAKPLGVERDGRHPLLMIHDSASRWAR